MPDGNATATNNPQLDASNQASKANAGPQAFGTDRDKNCSTVPQGLNITGTSPGRGHRGREDLSPYDALQGPNTPGDQSSVTEQLDLNKSSVLTMHQQDPGTGS